MVKKGVGPLNDSFYLWTILGINFTLVTFIINGQDEQKKKKYRKIDDKIANLVANFESENEMEFLKGIESNLHLFQTYL